MLGTSETEGTDLLRYRYGKSAVNNLEIGNSHDHGAPSVESDSAIGLFGTAGRFTRRMHLRGKRQNNGTDAFSSEHHSESGQTSSELENK
jgi:hypothetical protein